VVQLPQLYQLFFNDLGGIGCQARPRFGNVLERLARLASFRASSIGIGGFGGALGLPSMAARP
jgi:hypothetical protein